MNPEEQKLDMQIREGFLVDRNSTAKVRDDMNRHLTDVRIENLFQRRELLKHISLISAAILGLMTITADADITRSYFIVGASLHMIVIVLILSYLREHIDGDDSALQKQQDRYNDVLQEKIDLIDGYLEKTKLKQSDIDEYYQRLRSSPNAKELERNYKDLAVQRQDRQNQLLDYFSEMIIFLFLCASFLVFISFLNHGLSFWIIIPVLFFGIVSFSNSATFLAKYISKFVTFLKLWPKKEIELRKIDKLTIGDIIEDESKLILEADKRYGLFFKNATDFNALLQDFIKDVKIDGWIFAMFLSQVRKYHTLALFSAIRRHHIQAQTNLRQTIEAGINAAYGLANPDQNDFVKNNGLIADAPQTLTERRYKWLENNYKKHSDFLKNQKNLINTAIHSNMVYAFLNFKLGEKAKKGFETPFFDLEDKYLIQTDLWFIGNLAMGLMDLFLGINLKHNRITFKDGFIERLKELEAQNHKLKEEMMSHPRYKNAQLIREKLKNEDNL